MFVFQQELKHIKTMRNCPLKFPLKSVTIIVSYSKGKLDEYTANWLLRSIDPRPIEVNEQNSQCHWLQGVQHFTLGVVTHISVHGTSSSVSQGICWPAGTMLIQQRLEQNNFGPDSL